MRIDGIVCCTGKGYANLLQQSLPVWLDTLDSVTIVTKPTDDLVNSFKGNNLKIVTTNVFTRYGAHLNKGAALDFAWMANDFQDWVLHFDADITPPKDWRSKAESIIEFGKLYGAPRNLHDGRDGDPDNAKLFWPFGYFQLWHAKDPVTWIWPIFDPWHPHCGSYDADFAELWGKKNWNQLPFCVKHTGEPRTNWFGETKTHLMKPLLKKGLFKYRLMTQKGFGRLKIPEPKLKLFLLSRKPEYVQSILEEARQYGPFHIWVNAVSKRPVGKNWKNIKYESLDEIREMISESINLSCIRDSNV